MFCMGSLPVVTVICPFSCTVVSAITTVVGWLARFLPATDSLRLIYLPVRLRFVCTCQWPLKFKYAHRPEMRSCSLVEFCRVGSRVEPVCLTSMKCDTGETHCCDTSCLRDGAGVILVYSHWCYTVFYTIIKLVLILVISQEISVSYSNFELV